jgi:hypothetical protein
MAKKSAKEGNVLLQPLVIFEEHLAKLLTRQNEVLDLQETAAFLKASEEDVLRMVREQGLPARHVPSAPGQGSTPGDGGGVQG